MYRFMVAVLLSLILVFCVTACKPDGEPGAPPPVQDLATGVLDMGGGAKMELALIQPGSFMMGSEAGDRSEKPVHQVKMTQPFYMGKYEVTQEQYEAVMGADPSHFKGARNPVEQVSWNDAQEFSRKVSRRTGKTVRLPTEAEWEYACRAGSRTPFCSGDSDNQLGEYAWYRENSGTETHAVGTKKPNAWGLYDMHGNVCEWCLDWYDSDYYKNSPMNDPTGPWAGTARVLRGGSWLFTPGECRSALRYGDDPARTNAIRGFRVVVGAQ